MVEDHVQHLTYAKFVSRRLRRKERAVSLLYGSSLLRKKEYVDRPKIEAEPEAKALYCETANLNPEEHHVYIEPETGALFSTKKRGKGHFTMSPRTRRKVREKAQAFIHTFGASNCTFLTLTFINSVTDESAQKIFNKFFTVLRQTYNGRSAGNRASDIQYLYVVERQDGKRNGYAHCTGNVHYHVLLNRRLPVVETNGLWLRQQIRAGLDHPALQAKRVEIRRTMWRAGMGSFLIKEPLFLLSDKELQGCLNPLDIDDIKDESACAGYLVKYMAKGEESFGCQVWNCSRYVSEMATGVAITPEIWANQADQAANSVVTAKGERITAKTHIHQDKEGRTVAVTAPVLNLRYFNKKYLGELRSINRMILQHLDAFRRKEKTLDPFKVSRAYYLKEYSNFRERLGSTHRHLLKEIEPYQPKPLPEKITVCQSLPIF